MEDTRMEFLDDAELEQVSGGHGIGHWLGKGDCGSHGHGVVGAIVGKAFGIAEHVLEGVSHLVGKLGHGHGHDRYRC